MTSDQIALVEQSFAMVRPLRGQLAGLFYARLFDLSPELRRQFASANMNAQGQKLMGTLAMLVSNLRHPDVLASATSELGDRHERYGVTPAQYVPFGSALLWALEQALGKSWDTETGAAWQAAYSALSGSMIAQSHGAAADAAE